MNIYDYCKEKDIDIDGVRIDDSGSLYYAIIGEDDKGEEFYREVDLPEEVQTQENIDIIRQNMQFFNTPNNIGGSNIPPGYDNEGNHYNGIW